MAGRLFATLCLPLLAGTMACSASEANEGEESSAAEASGETALAEEAAGEEGAAAAETDRESTQESATSQTASSDLGEHIYHLEPAECQEGPGLMGARQAIAYRPESDPLRFFPEPARAAMSVAKREPYGGSGEVLSVAIDGLWNGLKLTSIYWGQDNGRWGAPQFVFEEPGPKVVETLQRLGYPVELNETHVGKVDDLTRSQPVIAVDEDAMGEPLVYFSCDRVPAR